VDLKRPNLYGTSPPPPNALLYNEKFRTGERVNQWKTIFFDKAS